jgi:hypothetical protein
VLKRFALAVRDWFAPFAAISSELRIIRELMELELASRHPPIIRITESPSKNDTTVSYDGDKDDKRAEAMADWED